MGGMVSMWCFRSSSEEMCAYLDGEFLLLLVLVGHFVCVYKWAWWCLRGGLISTSQTRVFKTVKITRHSLFGGVVESLQ